MKDEKKGKVGAGAFYGRRLKREWKVGFRNGGSRERESGGGARQMPWKENRRAKMMMESPFQNVPRKKKKRSRR